MRDSYNAMHNTTEENKRTITMTFRISKDVMEKLRHKAKEKGISSNMLVNQIFKNYVNWYKFEPKIGMIPLSKPIVISLFRDLRKDEIIDIATNNGKNAVYDIAVFMNAKVDIDSFLSWLESRMRNSSIHVSHIVKGTVHTYTFKHDICLNWSLYHKIILELIFGDVFKKTIDIQTAETSFTWQLEK